jgi:oligoendopeptidase F
MPESILPHWDLTAAYPGIRSPEFDAGCVKLAQEIRDCQESWDRQVIGHLEGGMVDAAVATAFDQALARWSSLQEHARILIGFIHCYVSTDSRDDYAAARLSETQQQLVHLGQLGTRLTAWIGSLDTEALLAASAVARDHEYLVRRAVMEAVHQMSPAEEDLATALNLTGGVAWGRLHEAITSRMTVQVAAADGVETLPMSVVRNRAFEPDRAVRRRAYLAELEAWQGVAVPLAAALNGIKGEDLALMVRRGWESPLDVALFNNHLDRPTLEAMMEAARASLPSFQRYLRAKARLLKLPTLAWYDIEAPVGTSTRAWAFADAREFILEQFGTFSPRLRGLAERAFVEHWIDAEPREGKMGGGYCLDLLGEQSRILVNYVPAFDGVSTLAHELGHAYHNLNLASRSPLLRATPSALAETASTFCETIIRRAGLARSPQSDQLSLLDASLSGQCQVVVDISSRFLFESRVFDRRRARDLSVEELNQIMLQSQSDTYGDALDQAQLHPFMWAVKGHYYSSWESFYNFPYMFGQLFGLGLYAAYEADPERFVTGYDDLLASTGMADAVDVAARFGCDVRSRSFWEQSLHLIAQDIDQFERLAAS